MGVRHHPDRKTPWEASVYANGKRHRRFFETKKDAQNFVIDWNREHRNVSGIHRNYSLKNAFASYIDTDSSQKTKASKEADQRIFDFALHFFKEHCGKHMISDIELEDLQKFQIWLEGAQEIGSTKKEPWGTTTIELYSRTLKKFFKKMRMLERIGKNPAEFWKVPRGTNARRRPMTIQEFKTIYAAAPEWYRPILSFIRLTGARGASVAMLTWSDVDFVNRRVILKSRKGGVKQLKEIPLPLYPALHGFLLAESNKLKCTAQPSRKTDPVFWGPHGLAVTAQEIATEGSRLIKSCGLEGVVLYGLRHAIAVDMTEAGIPLEVIRQVMGHSSLAQTSHYASGISQSVISDAVNRVRNRVENETPPPDTEGDDAPELGEN